MAGIDRLVSSPFVISDLIRASSLQHPPRHECVREALIGLELGGNPGKKRNRAKTALAVKKQKAQPCGSRPSCFYQELWRRDPESNWARRICNPLHNRFAIAPFFCDKKGKLLASLFGIWSGKRVSNSRPQPWQGCALPTELFPQIQGQQYSQLGLGIWRGGKKYFGPGARFNA